MPDGKAELVEASTGRPSILSHPRRRRPTLSRSSSKSISVPPSDIAVPAVDVRDAARSPTGLKGTQDEMSIQPGLAPAGHPYRLVK